MSIEERYEALAADHTSHVGILLVAEQIDRIATALGQPPDADLLYRYAELRSVYGHAAAWILLGETFARITEVVESLPPIPDQTVTVHELTPIPTEGGGVKFSTSNIASTTIVKAEPRDDGKGPLKLPKGFGKVVVSG